MVVSFTDDCVKIDVSRRLGPREVDRLYHLISGALLERRRVEVPGWRLTVKCNGWPWRVAFERLDCEDKAPELEELETVETATQRVFEAARWAASWCAGVGAHPLQSDTCATTL